MKLCRWIWFIGHDLFKETNELRNELLIKRKQVTLVLTVAESVFLK